MSGIYYLCYSENPTRYRGSGWAQSLGAIGLREDYKIRELSHAELEALHETDEPSKFVAALLGLPYTKRLPTPDADTVNAVEIVAMSESDTIGFNQPCRFGSLVEDHAVYCHNTWWIDAPRKCRRTWYTNGEKRDEDCPGFEPRKENA